MKLTDAQRAEIVATLHELRVGAENRFHVISSRGGWLVIRDKSQRARKTFTSKGEAIAYARDLAGRLQGELVVHTRDGGLETWESLREGVSGAGH